MMQRHPSTLARGFTLIELLIVMVVIAILASVAYPAYTESVRKSHRASAKAMMTRVAQANQQFYSEKLDAATYTNKLTELQFPAALMSESGGHSITVATPTSTTFTISASPINADAKCGVMTLDHLGTFLPAGC